MADRAAELWAAATQAAEQRGSELRGAAVITAGNEIAGAAKGAERPRHSLVIGIGNPLRRDDGVGWHLAEEVAGLSVHQLTPELAAELAAVDRVLFVDAWQVSLSGAAGGRLQPCLRSVSPGGDGLACSHRLEPAELLALASALYGAQPAAAELLLPAWEFAHGIGLSPSLHRQLPLARRLLRQWLQQGDA